MVLPIFTEVAVTPGVPAARALRSVAAVAATTPPVRAALRLIMLCSP